MPRPMRLGLTGGIGSGKSTLGQMLRVCGAALVDADAIARSVTAPGGAATAEIRAAFGPGAIDASGGMDRTRMRELAFTDPQARTRLEAIVHPWVNRLSDQLARDAVAAGQAVIVFDVPLLVESGRWARKLDAVLVVDCSAETQIERVMARNGLQRAAVLAILEAQASRKARRAAADVVVLNDGFALADLQREAEQIARLFEL
ncbi:dephospho-CoA kinase [Acidovorax delafieldii 2AN]|uniref:Dephospho-CoA kinase n=1 Tax=Acidovorax delafieldii 2AN TaxID=573060 RepID=C5T2F7_ACIDE|nr:dephospho-CoA kinase [Acidovorax delafieldii]EER61347.1 dephospho-CoA kinase [Acidovorax delafieldii 2AN]